jgi:hypothetical protein
MAKKMTTKTTNPTNPTTPTDPVEQLKEGLIKEDDSNSANVAETHYKPKPKMMSAAKTAKTENDPPPFSSASPKEKSIPIISSTPVFGDDDVDILRLNGDTMPLKRNQEKPSVIFSVGR